MAESTLSIQKSDIDQSIANYIGLTTILANLDTNEWAIIDAARETGLSRFYAERDWVMLEPKTTLTTVAAAYEFDLPDDFAALMGPMHHAANTGYRTLVTVGVGDIINFRKNSLDSSIPEYVAISPKTTDGSTGQRWEALFYPTPDAAYVLTYQYTRLANDLTDTYPYPYGGALHRNTIIEACLAAAETRSNDAIGLHEQRYQSYLALSIKADDKTRPSNIGYNGDGPGMSPLYPKTWATYNGSVPT